MLTYNKILRLLELILSFPKSFIVSWRLSSFRHAFKLPVKCRYNCKIVKTTGFIVGGGRISIGFNRTGIYNPHVDRAILNVSGRLVLNGKLNLGAGSRLEVGQEGSLVINGLVANSAATTICCYDYIEFGDKTVISWETLIMDKDFHYIMSIDTGLTKPNHKPIVIGKGTWLCAGSKVLKGAVLPDGCILSAGSVLGKEIIEKNSLLMGNPAEIVKRNVCRSDSEVSCS